MTLGTSHEKPVYVRLRETIADAILAGKYSDGDSLPSVRAFAAEQQANPLTVAKAYQGFQDEGLIVVSAESACSSHQAPGPGSAIPSAAGSCRKNGPRSEPGCAVSASTRPSSFSANAPSIPGRSGIP